MINLEKENFNDLINDGYVLVDFYASWCGPCKMMHPILDNVSLSRSNIKIVKVDIDKFDKLAAQYSVMSIPTLILFKNGLEIDKKIGFVAESLLVNWINENQ